jgi:hypothetical protein
LHKCSKAAGKASHPAYISAEGAEILKKRNKDFNFQVSQLPENTDFLFFSTSKTGEPVSREFLTRKVNACLKKVGIEPGYHHTTHCFRVGYITKLWKLTGDIELVRQVIGHVSLRGGDPIAKLGDTPTVVVAKLQREQVLVAKLPVAKKVVFFQLATCKTKTFKSK